jgi:aldehyde oxidoreductase
MSQVKPILFVNGDLQHPQALPSTRLSSYLRDELRLTGTKVGCEAGDCGACTVLLDDAPVCACITALGQCENRHVTTVEGLALPHATGNSLNRLQQAFHQAGAAQCGICTPGMLMAATALLAQHAATGTVPNREQVVFALAGVLCRCTGYQSIIDAVLAAAEPKVAPQFAPKGLGGVGERLPRIEGAAKLTGQFVFGADEVPANALSVQVLRSPFARAKFDLAQLRSWATRTPGIVALVSAIDVPFNGFAIFPDLRDQPVFAENETRFMGEAVAALVGEPAVIQALILADLPLFFEALPAAAQMAQALVSTSPLHANRPDNVLCRGRVVKGDWAESAIPAGPDQSSILVEASTSYVEHAYIEPEAGFVRLHGNGDTSRLEIFACTQTPYMDRDEVANILGWDATRIHIRPSGIGGGFGGKLDLSIQPILAVAAVALQSQGSAQAGRALRLVYDRPESMRSTTKRHPATMQARLQADAHGNFLAYDFSGDFNTGAYSSWGPTVANRVPIHASGPYCMPKVRALTRAVLTNNSISGAFRGFGVPQSTLLIEAAIDRLAALQGRDRLAIRLQNAIRAGDTTATGQRLNASVGMVQCLEALQPAWNTSLAQVAQFNAQAIAALSPLRQGLGVASMWYGIGNTVIANPSTIHLRALANGRYMLYNGAQEIGQGSYTIMVQIAAHTLGVNADQIDQVHSDTDLTPDAGKSSASRQTFVSGEATRLAALDLKRKISERRVGDPQADVTDLIGIGYFSPPTIALDGDGQGVPYACYGFAAQTALVQVDIELATVQVLHIHAAHDVGKAINPTLTEGQIHGGIAQGLGLALMEEYIAGRTDNLHDYLIPCTGDMPQMTTYLIEDPEPLGPYGAKGVGEPALVATAPAILSAIEHACGVRPAHLPVTPTRLWEAMKGQHGS